MIIYSLIWAAVGTLLSTFLVSWAKPWAVRLGALDLPDHRSLHRGAIPRVGGMVIVPLTIFGICLYHLLFGGESWEKLLGYLIPAGMVWLISLLDDLWDLPFGIRLAVQAIAVVLLIARCGYWQEYWIPGLGLVDFGALGVAVTFLWILGLTNAFNFMDGIDGIAASQAIAAGLGWYLALNGKASEEIALIPLMVAGTCLGFLRHNWSPASVFLGDSGSTFLGFTFASIGIMVQDPGSRMPVLAGFFVLPIVLDTFLTFGVRLGRGQNIFTPHQSHLYQRLVRTGMSHAQVSLIFLGLTTVSIVSILLWYFRFVPGGGFLLGGAILCTFAFWRFVLQREARTSKSRG